jgi:hypothetical protein
MPETNLGEVRVRMAAEEFGEIGFTAQDRADLTTLLANQENFKELLRDYRQSMERRLERLETERALKTDLERMERSLFKELGEKADRTELSGSAVTQLQNQVSKLDDRTNTQDRRLVWVYAFAAGAAFAGGSLGAVLMHLVTK